MTCPSDIGVLAVEVYFPSQYVSFLFAQLVAKQECELLQLKMIHAHRWIKQISRHMMALQLASTQLVLARCAALPCVCMPSRWIFWLQAIPLQQATVAVEVNGILQRSRECGVRCHDSGTKSHSKV